MKERGPIFYDVERRRWRRTRLVLEASGVVLTLLLAYFFVSIVIGVELPSLLLRDSRPAYHAVPMRPRAHPVTARSAARARLARVGKVAQTYDPLRAAFYVSWDPTSLASLKHHYKEKNLDVLMPEELHAVTPDGSITVVDYDKYQTVQVDPQGALAILQRDKLHRWMKSANVEIPIMGLVNNYDGAVWRIKEMAQMLANPTARRRLADALAEYASLAREVGLVLDFEEVPDTTQEHFRTFAAQLKQTLHAKGLKFMIALPARDPTYDYAYFASQSDAIILMNYDQHWLNSPPGPIAAQDWFVENINQIVREVSPPKIVMAIANYAYDWPQAPKKAHEAAESLSVQEALLRAKESEADIEFDPDSLNPHYSYSDERNYVHQVWMLDAVTAYNELRASERAGVQGTALWRLGSADSSIWPIWDVLHPDDATRAALENVAPGPDLILEGDGDIWRIADTPKNGQRTFQYDPASNLIVQETYVKIPLSWDIEQMGAAPGKIALSFDDGPDPRWTPRILDILRQKNAPATFFVIGDEANRNPSLLKREYAEGHEIGNHTYTHPRFDDLPHSQLRLQLNLTQRLIESLLGVKSLLFRPPYGIDHQPEYAEEIEDLPIPQDMGYILIGARIDPHDWQQTPGAQMLPDEIVASAVQQLKVGHIVLLHDGGGDREHTVQALPQLIDALRVRGYQLVLVSDLLGKTRDQVMTPLSPKEQLEARADGFVFELYHLLRLGMASIFLLGIVLVSARAVIVGLLAMVEKLRRDPPDELPDPPPSVSVLIPAYNEEKVIVETVRAALHSDYPDLRVIVVNDGSADRTGELLDSNFGSYSRVKIIHQSNRGKSAALNRALAEAGSDIVVTIDADTEVERDAIRKLVRHFSDPTVGAAAGNVKVGNRSRWLTRWQALEYITSQNLEKRAFDLLNCITVVPGALGAWRRTTVQALGGFTTDTVAEDADLTIAIRRAGWRVSYDEWAVAWTEAPETLSALIRQRFRWTFGTLQSVWKHRETLFQPKYGTLGWVALPNIFVFQLLLPLISPVIDLTFLGSLLLWGLAQFKVLQLPQIWTTADLERSVVFFLMFMLIDVLTCAVAFALEKREDWTLLIPVLLQRFYYRQMMYVVIFRSFMRAVQGRAVGWRGVEPDVPAPAVHA
jgi:cellulose synthase/poly-beta-1,6-N-acetylglucosamine synthase-like glycosyltransferase/peptidoglycan/xylan/chitin deacetylase (PgdA/CDA1 family)/spore germination protein YaaH